MNDILKRKICKEKSKGKRSKMLLNMIASVYSRRCRSYRMYLEGDSPHKKCDVNDICVLRHRKIGISNIIGYFFSLSNNPMYDILKRKICKEKLQEKRSKMLLNIIASMYFRRCGSYRMYLEGDSLH